MTTIKQQIIITTQEKTTENGRYEYKHTIIDGKLVSIECKVHDQVTYDTTTAEGEHIKQTIEEQIGALHMEYSIVKASSFPYSPKYPLYIADFANITNEIIKNKTSTNI